MMHLNCRCVVVETSEDRVMYETPDYHKLTLTMNHFQTVKRYIDLARTFRSMAYDQELVLTSTNDSTYVGRREGKTVTIKDSLKGDLLKMAADQCETVAIRLMAAPPETFDVKEACRV